MGRMSQNHTPEDAWKARDLVTAVSAPQSQPVPSSLEPLPIPARRRFGR